MVCVCGITFTNATPKLQQPVCSTVNEVMRRGGLRASDRKPAGVLDLPNRVSNAATVAMSVSKQP